MIGKIATIKRWDQTEGQVMINGESWQAHCEIALPVGGKAVVQDVQGVILKLQPYED